MGPEEAICQCFVLPQETEQQVLRLDVGASELARLIARKEYYASGLFGIPFKHTLSRLLDLQSSGPDPRAASPRGSPVLTLKCDHTFWRIPGCESQIRTSIDDYD